VSILVGSETRVVFQGITGGAGAFHARQCIAYGTTVVAGSVPGRGGETFEASGPDDRPVRVPIFDTVREAVRETHADTSCIFVPAAGAADAILEAAAASLGLVVAITEGIPVMDMVRVRRALAGGSTRLIGPNCPGIITPGRCKIGIMPGAIHRPGHVGVISRSGTLTYEAVGQLTALGLGQSTAVGIGGDPVGGMDFIDLLDLFERDADTSAVLLIGEIGGSAEEDAAAWIQRHMTKPVAAFIAGTTAPPGRRMGHAGAIISAGKGTAADKIRALSEAGVKIAPSPADMGSTLKSLLNERYRPVGSAEMPELC
jgi:succinyl-CoA synthetase alpha subunit